MLWTSFWQDRAGLDDQYARVRWIEGDSLSPEALAAEGKRLTRALLAEGVPKPIVKARLFALAMDRAAIAVEPLDFFQDHLRHGFIVQKQRAEWIETVIGQEMPDLWAQAKQAYALGAYSASYDFGHTTPDWDDVLALGFTGLLERIRRTRAAREADGTLTEDARTFYGASELVYEAVLRYINRLRAACETEAARQADPAFRERLLLCADTLAALCARAPQTLHEALQTAYLFHILQEEVEGERLRSLGGFDRLYAPFYHADLESGRLTQTKAKTLLQYFFQKFHALTGDSLNGEPFYIGGTLPDGTCAVGAFTGLVLEAYDELSIPTPKIHVRLTADTPRGFLRSVCDCIRRGNSSFVFICDDCAIPMMQKIGATLEEARSYVPIGCYEPGIMGREVACTGNGGFSMPKALELALHDGVDPLSGAPIGAKTGDPAGFATFESLMEAVKRQQRQFIADGARVINAVERLYMQMNPSPLFSATMIECVERGMDAYAGGAKYNNTSFYAYGNGTAADALAAIYKLVYQEQAYTLPQLTAILDGDWQGHEPLRMRMLRDEDKWGNNRDLPDRICVELAADCAEAINSQKNARGGRYKAAMFSIDYCLYYGSHTGATADGRRRGEPLSKNLGATTAMDRRGVTALIRSITKLDLTEFPTGSVLDIVMHPSAVAGEEGLDAFAGLIEAYRAMGGFAIHGNVFDAQILREAQARPERYKNLQVRVCGWNVYFNNLSRVEQDLFIRQAENAVS